MQASDRQTSGVDAAGGSEPRCAGARHDADHGLHRHRGCERLLPLRHEPLGLGAATILGFTGVTGLIPVGSCGHLGGIGLSSMCVTASPPSAVVVNSPQARVQAGASKRQSSVATLSSRWTTTSPEIRFAKPSRETVKCGDTSPAARCSTGGKGGSNRTSSLRAASPGAATSAWLFEFGTGFLSPETAAPKGT